MAEYKEIKRWVLIQRNHQGPYVLRYTLRSGKVKEKATKETVRRKAEQFAANFLHQADQEAELRIHGWEEFCQRYEQERLSKCPYKTREAFLSASARLADLCPGISFIEDLTAEVLVTFAHKIQAEGKSPATAQAYRDHIMSALKWAERVGIIAQRPSPPKIERVPTGARGRALSREEFNELIAKLPEVVGEEQAPLWQWNCEALWRSGFRLGETFDFYWEPEPGKHWVEGLDTDRPKIRISADAEKGFKDRVIPMAPDFAELLKAVPEEERTGLVFKWPMTRGFSTSTKTVSKRISKCGELARIVVGRKTNGDPKYASAHDFRRSFGARWAPHVMPFVLQSLMRHASISTTQKFYVGANADRVAETLYSVGSIPQ